MQGLEVQDISKTYRGKRAVDSVSFHLQRGEIVGLLGPNGAGKTTTFRMIVGQVRPGGGKVLLDGRVINRLPMHKRARMGIGYLPQEPSIFRGLTVMENLEAVLELQRLNRVEVMSRCHELLERVGIESLASQMAYSLSGGEKRRLEIARALCTSPSFMLLDEPFSGVDPIAVAEIQELIYELRELGIGILITDHSVRETLEVTDRAYIINEGNILASGPADQLVKDERVREIYLGEKFYIRTDLDLKVPRAMEASEDTADLKDDPGGEKRLLQKVRTELNRFQMLEGVDHLLLAVSGGPDSVAMVHLFDSLKASLGLKLSLAHLDHQFRGEESAEDLRFVKAMSEEMGLPCYVSAVDIPAILEQEGGNAQEVARRERYRFLGRVAVENGCQAVATGHHADDQVETVLMELLRGAGAAGLSGIPPVARLAPRIKSQVPSASEMASDAADDWSAIRVIRPLLDCSKQELITWLRRNRIRFRTDSSNESSKYLRNRIRNELLPRLTAEYNPNLRATISNMATILRDEDQLLHSMATDAFVDVAALDTDGSIVLDLTKFNKLETAVKRRVLLLAIRRLGSRRGTMTYNTCALHIETILDVIMDADPQSSIDLPGGIVALKRYRRLNLKRGEESAADYEVQIQNSDEVHVPEAGVRFQATKQSRGEGFDPSRTEEELAFGHYRACFDAASVQFPLTLRNRRDGDRIQPLGMRGSKKVKNLLIDEKVPLETRARVPIVEDATGRIIWVAGFTQDHQTRVQDSTTELLILDVEDEAEKSSLELE